MDNTGVGGRHFTEAIQGWIGERRGAQATLLRQVLPLVSCTSEHLRKQLLGERTATREVMEAAAKVMGVEPDTFLEYQGMMLEEALKRYPDLLATIYADIMAEVAARDALRTEPSDDQRRS